MQTLTVYSSVPTGTPISLALLGLEAQGLAVTLRPLSELPTPGPRRASLRAELCEVCLELATIGERLDEHEAGHWHLDAGLHQGLLFDREALLTRKRAIEASLRQEGRPAC